MKNTIVKFTTILTVLGFYAISANAQSYKTIIKAAAPPTQKQLNVAIEMLSEAMDISEASKAYADKVNKAKSFLNNRSINIEYKAEIYCGKTKINDQAYIENKCHLYSGNRKLCFNGATAEAVRLLNAMFAKNKFNWDEEWFENARVENSKLMVDFVDGPNEMTDTIEVLTCK